MSGVRVTDAAVAAAFDVVYPEAQYGGPVPIGARAYVFRILEAAAPHMTVDGLGAMLGRLERAQNVSDVEDVCQDLRAFLHLPREEVSPWASTS